MVVPVMRSNASAQSPAAKIAAGLGALLLSDETIEEIEINPLMVKPDGAVAVDALVRVRT